MLKILLIIFGILISLLCYSCCVISGRISKEEENQEIYIKYIEKSK